MIVSINSCTLPGNGVYTGSPFFHQNFSFMFNSSLKIPMAIYRQVQQTWYLIFSWKQNEISLSTSKISCNLGIIRAGQYKAILPKACTAEDFSSIKLTSTSIPTKSASSSLSESRENASLGFYSSSSFTPALDLQVLRTSFST